MENIGKSDLTYSEFFGKLDFIRAHLKFFDCLLIPDLASHLIKKLLGCIIAFRMYGCLIERFFSSIDTKETCALLECFGSEFGNFLELCP